MSTPPPILRDLIGQEHVSRFLAAAINQGESSHAYLFHGPKGVGKYDAALKFAATLSFVFHLDVAVSRERLAGRATTGDNIEGEPLAFHQEVEDGYRKLEEMYPGRIVGVDGGWSVEEVQGDVVAASRERLGLEF